MMNLAVGIAIGLIVVGFASYLILMIFFPEWVGITGKSAHKTLAEHVEGSESKDSDWLSREPKK